MNPECPLRYSISNWHQANKCKSNNSRDLRIVVSDYIHNDKLCGLKISVEHSDFGVLFATVLNARGLLITHHCNGAYNISEDLSKDTILAELAKYGFFITFNQELNLSIEQLEYLMTLKELKYDKLRILTVVDHAKQQATNYVVAFQVNPLGDWLNAAYEPSTTEFTSALVAGTAINLTDVSKTRDFQWEWLYNLVVNIDDVLEENADKWRPHPRTELPVNNSPTEPSSDILFAVPVNKGE